MGHILFFVAVIPAFAEDVDPEEGEHGEAQPVVPGRNIPVHGACKQKTQHGHQELTGPGGQGELDSVAQTLLLNEQAVGERHDASRQAACSLRRGTLGYPREKAIFLFLALFPDSKCGTGGSAGFLLPAGGFGCFMIFCCISYKNTPVKTQAYRMEV